MKRLIAVVTCQFRRRQANAQRSTWVKDLPSDTDVAFFVGGGGTADFSDEIMLDVDDSYVGLPAKVKAAMSWMRNFRVYDFVLKVDDDTYVVPQRLDFLAESDYAGNFRPRNGKYPEDYASGFAYQLSAKAVAAVADAPLTDDTFEDRWVGNVLGAVRPRLWLRDEKRFICSYPGIEEPEKLWGSPIGRTHIAFAQYPAEKFEKLYLLYHRVFDKIAE